MSAPECGGGVEEDDVTVENLSRKEKRKMLKRMKRKEKRKEVAAKEREEEEKRMNDPQELRRMEALEREERERVERERMEFEERERLWMERMEEMRRKEEEEAEERTRVELEELPKDLQVKDENNDGEDDCEYVEEGPAEIIWQGNEIIVKKKRVKVPKKKEEQARIIEETKRPTSNPLPPQSEAYSDFMNVPMNSTQQVYDSLAQQVPSFGTEQDKAHCPFHIKTGVCRFGSRCNRAHYYPDKSSTLLIKNMYLGPGLAWEQDEGLENTDEEVEQCFEEFYEDVHTEFLKFGEVINFKVCRNGSAHLRGNVYVHYKSLESALLAYHSVNGRFFAGKQVKCEFVGVTRWKVAICGEYMKSRLSTCSRGTACNFLHCFRNPGGDYEWADWDKPPPKYWMNKMAALFGYADEYCIEEHREMLTPDADRYYRSQRSRSRDRDLSQYSTRGDHYKRDFPRDDMQRQRHKIEERRRDYSEEVRPRDKIREPHRSRRREQKTRNHKFGSEDEFYESSIDSCRSSKEPFQDSNHGNRVEVNGDSSDRVSRMCECESDEGGFSPHVQDKGDSSRYYNHKISRRSRDRDKHGASNWDRGIDGCEDDNMHTQDKQGRHAQQEQNTDVHKKKEEERKRRHDVSDVYKHREEYEIGHEHKNRRRRTSEYREDSYDHSRVCADKKKRTGYSDDTHQLISPSCLAVGVIDDRWDPAA